MLTTIRTKLAAALYAVADRIAPTAGPKPTTPR